MASSISSLDPENENLCQEFAAITGTDRELAIYYLAQKSWKMEDALNMFFDDQSTSRTEGDGGAGVPRPVSQGSATDPQVSQSSSTSSGDAVPSSEKGAGQQSLKEKSTTQTEFCVITWNIDGLDERDFEERTRAVCKTLKSYSPDIIFLQEVIPKTCPLICAQLNNYEPIPAADRQYFTLVLLKKATVTGISSKVEHFPKSGQGRALQIVQCRCADVDLRLMCTHLESIGSETEERQCQFSRALYLMKTAPQERTVIFGGDTNLRDKEVSKVGLPGYILDLWQTCGSPADARDTWDLTENDNLNWPYPNRPRLRFDRLYLRQARPAPRAAPKSFALIGKERLQPCGRFASDHWGILCSFEVLPPPAP